MAWETRGNGRYYYRKRRIGGRCVSEYVGAGLSAELSAEIDAYARALVAEDRAVLQREREADAELDAALDRAGLALRGLTAAVLVAAGYHMHKRQWRKRAVWQTQNR